MAEEPLPRGAQSRDLALDLQICEEEIAEHRRAARRHGLFTLLGASPASVLPMLGLAADFGFQMVVVASVFVAGLEAWRWVQARADQRTAEQKRERLVAKLSGEDL